MLKEEESRMRLLLIEAISTLCRSGIQYKTGMKVEGLIGITVDDKEIMLVNVNKEYGLLDEENRPESPKEEVQTEKKQEPEKGTRQKRKSTRNYPKYDESSCEVTNIKTEQDLPHVKKARTHSDGNLYDIDLTPSILHVESLQHEANMDITNTSVTNSTAELQTNTQSEFAQTSNSGVDEDLIHTVKVERSSDSENEDGYYEQYQGDSSSFSFTPDMEFTPVPVSVYSADGSNQTIMAAGGTGIDFAVPGSSQDSSASFGTSRKVN